MSKQKPVTIVDIAEAAGVSIATVSNVLNRRNVAMAEETIRKVEQTAKELGYRRNAMAANLSRQKSYELGILLPSFSGYYGKLAEILERTAHSHGYHVSVFSAGGLKPEMEKRHLEVLLQRRVDGLICHGLAMSPESTRAIVGDGTPLVLFNAWGWPGDLALGAVNLDFAGGAAEAVDHLVRQGCGPLVYVARSSALAVNEQRLIGFNAGIAKHAANRPVHFLELSGSSMEAVAAEAVKLTGGEQPVGVLVFDDYSALSFMSQCLKAGIRIPEQMKVVGINNDPVASVCYPDLTTLAIDYEQQAQVVIRLMLDKLEGKTRDNGRGEQAGEASREHTIPMKLIERMSTGTPSAG